MASFDKGHFEVASAKESDRLFAYRSRQQQRIVRGEQCLMHPLTNKMCVPHRDQYIIARGENADVKIVWTLQLIDVT